MASSSLFEASVLSPLGFIGRGALGSLSYLGGVGTLSLSAFGSAFRRGEEDTPLISSCLRQTWTYLFLGIPLVGLAHVGMGSFLSMQAYYGGTFVDGTGAVVGVGLVRNVAPLVTGLILAGVLAPLLTSELRGRATWESRVRRVRIPDRGIVPGLEGEEGSSPSAARLAAVRLIAALVAGPILCLWAIVVGTVVGWQVAQELLGVSTHSYFHMFTEMLWVRDVIGVVFKGMAYALFAAAFACHEGLRESPDTSFEGVVFSAFRAACLATLAMLIVNSGWFLLVYHAGPPFGPTLLNPPSV
ncbi:ABC transporter permease [Singulisphaera sp. PoT]|uniref:ABC transporter permease n=1 Tax=Singulisphaera sp. PoT TaxID=3411797 RepID=UPI003BF51115